jgi:hypothetical protein
MSCRACASANQTEFAAEMNIHLSGPANLTKPGIFVFPRLLVCLDCGFSQLAVPETELTLLRNAPDTAAANGNGRVDHEAFRHGTALRERN